MAEAAEWLAIGDAITAEGFENVSVEGVGTGCPFIYVPRADGSIVLFGDVNETWMGDIYPNQEAVETGDGPVSSIDTEIPTSTIDPAAIAEAFARLFRVTVAHGSCVTGEELAQERALLSPAEQILLDKLPKEQS